MAQEISQVVRFRVQRQQLAIDVMAVDEVMQPREVSTVPGQPSFVAGVIHLRGEYIPLVDMRDRFGVPREGNESDKIVVVRGAEFRLALAVDGVGEVEKIDPDELSAPPVDSGLGGPQSLIAVFTRDEEMVMLLDVETLLSADERARLPSLP